MAFLQTKTHIAITHHTKIVVQPICIRFDLIKNVAKCLLHTYCLAYEIITRCHTLIIMQIIMCLPSSTSINQQSRHLGPWKIIDKIFVKFEIRILFEKIPKIEPLKRVLRWIPWHRRRTCDKAFVKLKV